MLTRLKDTIYLTKAERSFAMACAAIIAMAAGLAVLVMSGVEGEAAISPGSSAYVYWITFSGAASAGIALFAARGWLGQTGAMGLARAIVGSTAVALLAAIIAGTLIAPVYGTFYAPVLVATEFVARPWLVVAWYGILLGAHYMMIALHEERAFGLHRSAHRSAASQLSSLSRANLYNRD